jgi:hypothetical protein
MQLIKQSESTAARRTIFIGPLANTADDSAYTSTLTGADLRISKAGGSESNSAGTATHIANGLFKYEFTAGECDTLGALSVRVAKTGVYGDVFVSQVVPLDPYDATALGLSRLDAAVSTRLASSTYEAPDTLLTEASGIEPGLTLQGALRLILAATSGRRSGIGTGTELYRDYGNTKARVSMVFDSNGNTSSVTYDPT